MSQAAMAGGTVETGVLWRAPGLAVERAKDWGQVSVAVFRRGGGHGAWHNPRHRIILSPALIGPAYLRFDGGPTRSLTVEPGTVGFYPAGVEVSGSHGPGQVVQVLQSPFLYSTLMPGIGPGGLGLSPSPTSRTRWSPRSFAAWRSRSGTAGPIACWWTA